MQSVFAAMGRCPLFEGIPKEKYSNVLTCLQGRPGQFQKTRYSCGWENGKAGQAW